MNLSKKMSYIADVANKKKAENKMHYAQAVEQIEIAASKGDYNCTLFNPSDAAIDRLLDEGFVVRRHTIYEPNYLVSWKMDL